MLEAFKRHIEDHFPFLTEGKLLVACSGGVDSVVLTRLLSDLKLDITLAHCNFALRGEESDSDERFVENLAETLNVPVRIKHFDTLAHADSEKQSIQMAARELRYSWFQELAETEGYDYILTGHHMDDDLETFLINLSRGTGLRGLTGIPVINDKIIRPLLIFSREEIGSYARQQGFAWCEDSSNKDVKYLRNKLRNEVIPLLKETNDRFLSNFERSQKHIRSGRALIEDYLVLIRNLIMTETPEGYELNIQKLKELPNTDTLLYELLSDFGFTAWEDISELLDAQSGKQVFSENFRLIKDRERLLLVPKKRDEAVSSVFISEGTQKITEPLVLEFTKVDSIGELDRDTIFVDKAKLKFPLELRPWREGDTFKPFGMNGNKKLSKFFKDEKLSLVAKEKITVLCSDERVVWVVGMRMANDYKVTANTAEILKIAKRS